MTNNTWLFTPVIAIKQSTTVFLTPRMIQARLLGTTPAVVHFANANDHRNVVRTGKWDAVVLNHSAN